eukprot:1141935-Pelagomonas_calceolata.AAC.2
MEAAALNSAQMGSWPGSDFTCSGMAKSKEAPSTVASSIIVPYQAGWRRTKYHALDVQQKIRQLPSFQACDRKPYLWSPPAAHHLLCVLWLVSNSAAFPSM